MRAFYPVCQVAEFTAGYGYTTKQYGKLSLNCYIGHCRVKLESSNASCFTVLRCFYPAQRHLGWPTHD